MSDELDKAVALAEPMYLVMAGGDAFESRIVPESQLDNAYLLMQWASLDDIDEQQRAGALANFHDDDSWTHEQVEGSGKRIEFSINFEDGYVKVVRLPDADIAAMLAERGQQHTEELANKMGVMQEPEHCCEHADKPSAYTKAQYVEAIATSARMVAELEKDAAQERESRAMFIARLENAKGSKWLSNEAVLEVLDLLNDCDMLASQTAMKGQQP